MTTNVSLESWLRDACAAYSYDLLGIYRSSGTIDWPLKADSPVDLNRQLVAGGHILPLPKEPASLANVLEVSIADHILDMASRVEGLQISRGTERGYPDLEFSGSSLGGKFHAVDIKVAKRRHGRNGVSKNTQSRITLYTGNTYFKYPTIQWPGTFRPFADYSSHLDILIIYTLNDASASRVEDIEIIVQEPWKIASKQRSSTTREYIGAVNEISALRDGKGEFSSPQEFYAFWRQYPFKIGKAVEQQLRRLLDEKTSD